MLTLVPLREHRRRGGSAAGLDAVSKKKISCLFRDSNYDWKNVKATKRSDATISSPITFIIKPYYMYNQALLHV
jgi:hypothetical protein